MQNTRTFLHFGHTFPTERARAFLAEVAALATTRPAPDRIVLVSACDSPTMISIRSRLFEQAERYVALSIMSTGPLRDDVTEHKQLMRAALNREIDKTIELNRVHITRTLDKVAASLAVDKTQADLRMVIGKTLK